MADVDPIQTGDGSQAATAASFRVGNFGPSPTPQIKTNVAAPLDVRGGPGQATYLAAQLQQSLESMRWPLMTAERVAGMQHAKEMTEQGRGDATQGNVNQELLDKDQAYRQGAMTTLGQKYGYQLADWAKNQMNDPNSGWAGMSQQQVLQQVDTQARKAMGGMENDSVFASAAAPIVQHVHNEVLGWSIKTQHDAMGQQMRSNTGAQLQMASQGGPAFNFSNTFTNYKKFFGGDGGKAYSSLTQDVISYALGNNDPSALSSITPAPGQPSLPPKTMQQITAAQSRIRAQLTSAGQQLDKQNQLGAMRALISGGNAASITQRYLSSPFATPAAARSLLSFSKALTDSQSPQVASGGAEANFLAGIYTHEYTSTGDIIRAAQSTGATGKALVKMVQDGTAAYSKVQSVDHSDPFFKSTIADLNETYKPATGPLGNLLHPTAAAQHAGILADFNTEYEKKLQNGSSSEDAAYQASQAVKKKWGDPLDQQQAGSKWGAPKSYEEQLQMLRETPHQARASGMAPSDIQNLADAGMISQEQALAAFHSYFRK